jgi:hypothetical protein
MAGGAARGPVWRRRGCGADAAWWPAAVVEDAVVWLMRLLQLTPVAAAVQGPAIAARLSPGGRLEHARDPVCRGRG